MLNYHIFDHVKEYVYVADIETNELIYVNQNILDNYGYSSLEEVVGKKCYLILQDKKEPCDFCTNCFLKENDVYEWKVHNSIVNKDFVLRDIIIKESDRKYRLEIAGLEDSLTEDRAKRYEMHERLINEAFGIASKETDIERVIEKFLALIGGRMNADRVYIFEFNKNSACNTYEWCGEGISAQINNLQNIDMVNMKAWVHLFEKEGRVYIKHLEEIRQSYPEVYRILKPQAIDSLLAKPILINNQTIGFYGADNIDQIFLDDIEGIMDTCGSMMSMLIEKRDYYRYMQRISTKDPMTELLNRQSAEVRIENLLKDGNGTFLILDLDNFKQVNDIFGHYQGDILLKSVASKMREVCRETDVAFRIGGDEFGIYFPIILEKHILESKCEELLNKLSMSIEYGKKTVRVSASIGVSMANQKCHNFLQLYQKADEALYAAKRNGKDKYVIYELSEQK